MTKGGVFPASGTLGTSIINHLKLVPASQLILIARHPETSPIYPAPAQRFDKQNYGKQTALKQAFNGVGMLVLISYASVEVEYQFEVGSVRTYSYNIILICGICKHKAAITATRNSSLAHIFYFSLAFGGDLSHTSISSIMRAHLLTEQYLSSLLAQEPTTYTAIRGGLYSESFPVYKAWFDIHNPVGEITIPHSGDGLGMAWAKTDELGEATAKMIASYVQSSGDF